MATKKIDPGPDTYWERGIRNERDYWLEIDGVRVRGTYIAYYCGWLIDGEAVFDDPHDPKIRVCELVA